ncbi:MAG: phosphoribosylformylglycinamidine synthase subunit PurS [Candidatus Thermoplasmatota archaeon]|nr:phosphoribosylformylglycinamidine synthase subunit PurS [Candidatus Thermoplasmatota archaeon]MCL5665739.1 phosphoribosylformylglycinamidine synthase subunit PurS [Candidatus Thermoplasmatota archaeon]
MPRVRIEVSYLKGVEDPEAVTILKNLRDLGYDNVKEVRITKAYDLLIPGKNYRKVATEIAEKLMVNPVIHHMELKILDEGKKIHSGK